jgi:hypothetical protein
MSYSSTERGRPSKVTFERCPIENVNRSQEENRVVFDDVDYVTLHQQGSSNTTIHRVDEWWAKLQQQSRNSMIPVQWVDEYKEAYEMWQSGKDPIVQGTHLSEWPKISRSEAEMWNAVHVRTVEELAEANEQTMESFGMGGRKMRTDAREFLESLGSNEKLQEQLAKQQEQIDALLDKLADATEPKKTVKKTSTKKAVTKT